MNASRSHPHYDSHSLAFRREREDLQDVVVHQMTLRCSQGHAVQIALDQRETHLLCPRHKCYLHTSKITKSQDEHDAVTKAQWTTVISRV